MLRSSHGPHGPAHSDGHPLGSCLTLRRLTIALIISVLTVNVVAFFFFLRFYPSLPVDSGQGEGGILGRPGDHVVQQGDSRKHARVTNMADVVSTLGSGSVAVSHISTGAAASASALRSGSSHRTGTELRSAAAPDRTLPLALPPVPSPPPPPPLAPPAPMSTTIGGISFRLCNGVPCPNERPDPIVAHNQSDWPTWWFAPFFDKTSFGKEASNLVLGMLRSGAVAKKDLWVGTSQGNCNYGVDSSMPRVDFDELEAAKQRVDMKMSAIVVCHSLPPFWARPKNKWQTCAPCPPVGYKAAVTVGRAMAETDRYNPEFVRLCNRMDEVWVPSSFSYDVLIASGVPESKLRIVPIAVNSTFYDPAKWAPVPMPMGDLVFGRHRRYIAPPPPQQPSLPLSPPNPPHSPLPPLSPPSPPDSPMLPYEPYTPPLPPGAKQPYDPYFPWDPPPPTEPSSQHARRTSSSPASQPPDYPASEHTAADSSTGRKSEGGSGGSGSGSGSGGDRVDSRKVDRQGSRQGLHSTGADELGSSSLRSSDASANVVVSEKSRVSENNAVSLETVASEKIGVGEKSRGSNEGERELLMDPVEGGAKRQLLAGHTYHSVDPDLSDHPDQSDQSDQSDLSDFSDVDYSDLSDNSDQSDQSAFMGLSDLDHSDLSGQSERSGQSDFIDLSGLSDLSEKWLTMYRRMLLFADPSGLTTLGRRGGALTSSEQGNQLKKPPQQQQDGGSPTRSRGRKRHQNLLTKVADNLANTIFGGIADSASSTDVASASQDKKDVGSALATAAKSTVELTGAEHQDLLASDDFFSLDSATQIELVKEWGKVAKELGPQAAAAWLTEKAKALSHGLPATAAHESGSGNVWADQRASFKAAAAAANPPTPPKPVHVEKAKATPTNHNDDFDAAINVSKPASATDPKPFVFVSCFKWEMRKGWDVLLQAYLSEFSIDDNVELYILTKPFVDGNNFKGDMRSWVVQNMNLTAAQHARLPTLYVIPSHITNEQYVGLYTASDAFVIPTRGEGWGMPITEAMSMGLPVIVTNWSGTTAFVDDSVGYLLNYSLSQVPEDELWWFRGARWADVDVGHMREVIRHVYNNREEAARKGKLARQRMVDLYSPAAVGAVIAKELDRLKTMLRSKDCDRCHISDFVAQPGDTKLDLYHGNEPFLQDKKKHKTFVHATSNAQTSFTRNDISMWEQVVRQMARDRMERIKSKQETRVNILTRLSSRVKEVWGKPIENKK